MQYDDKVVINLYVGYLDWIKEHDLEDNMDNYIYYINNVQTIFCAEKIY